MALKVHKQQVKYLIILLVLFSSCLGKSQITENEKYHAIEFTACEGNH